MSLVRNQGTAPGDTLSTWIATHAAASGLSVRAIPLAACEHWLLDHGVLRHDSGRFFSVVGYRCNRGPAHLQALQLPMIDQPEVGILGFVVRRAATGWEWLLQAKTEPGNVGGTQVGPSVQATYSNYMRVHGGQPTRMLELFRGDPTVRDTITDVEQSEQGDRFLGKYNRNAVVEVAADFPSPDESSWRWFGAAALRDALEGHYTFNTDARSVMLCTDWRLLTDHGYPSAFARWRDRGGFGANLLGSAECDAVEVELQSALERLGDAQATTIDWERVALNQLQGWQVDASGVRALDPYTDPRVHAYAVQALDREVQAWCQPMLTNRFPGRVVLVCAQQQGVLRFLLNISFEPGFREAAQFAPSWVSGIGHANPPGLLAAIDATDSCRHAQVMQSDEGGRFMHSVARYEVIEVGGASAQAFADAGVWVSLASLRRMAAQRGLLSNELRSVCSLLLKWC